VGFWDFFGVKNEATPFFSESVRIQEARLGVISGG